ncbi:MAG TPA: acetolactate synthase large subunit, partial [Lachnospiraceae bacterium]|nr:acetolactate synthase large subunit [Lachnospiraceae bacterium]
RQWQTLFYGKRYSATVLNDGVDYVAIAKGMGAQGYRITKKEEVAKVLKQAIKDQKAGKTVVIDVRIDEDDKVWPMVAPGASISEAKEEKDFG